MMALLNGSSSSTHFEPPADCASDPTREVCEEANVRRCHPLDVGGGDGGGSCPEAERNCTIVFEERCRQPAQDECREEEKEECEEEDEVVEDCHEVLLENCTGTREEEGIDENQRHKDFACLLFYLSHIRVR